MKAQNTISPLKCESRDEKPDIDGKGNPIAQTPFRQEDKIKLQWKPSPEVINGIRLARLQKAKDYEDALVCRHGEVWEYSPTHYAAVVTDARAANRLITRLELNKKRRSEGEELMFQFPKAQLDHVLAVLDPITDVLEAVEKANNFGL